MTAAIKKIAIKIVKGIEKQSKNNSINELTVLLDNFLIDLLKLKNKYKI